MNNTLESAIYIHLITAEHTIRTNFAGAGRDRRRSGVLTRLLAEHLIHKLSSNYTFLKDGDRVPNEELFGLLYSHLMAVPDDVAKASVARTNESEAANKAIAHSLYLALDMAFERAYESQNYINPASPRYIHRVAAA